MFCGQVVTLKLFEDNSLVKAAVDSPGQGRVLVDATNPLAPGLAGLSLEEFRSASADRLAAVRESAAGGDTSVVNALLIAGAPGGAAFGVGLAYEHWARIGADSAASTRG